MRWDVISAVLTVASMIAVGQRKWQGWGLAFLNSVAVCILAVSVVPKQWALIPSNVFCLANYTRNLIVWQSEAREGNISGPAHRTARLHVWPRLSRPRLHHQTAAGSELNPAAEQILPLP